jgi:hypothetical protein
MKAYFRRFFVAVLLVAAACGSSREEERQDRIREICDGLVGQTVRFGEESLSSQARIPERIDPCRTDWTELSSNDVCAYDEATAFCLVGWNFVSNDPNACSSRGCYYACLVHVSEADLVANRDTGQIPICASRFVSGQPLPVIQ